MSTTIEQRVVEMRFDNKYFEKNVNQTMSTLEKLKAKLNLTGASKGLENLNTSANKVNMNGLSNAVENVGKRFSAMEVIGITALARLVESNKLTPESIRNYAKPVLKQRLDLMYGTNVASREQFAQLTESLGMVIKNATQTYDLVWVDLPVPDFAEKATPIPPEHMEDE